METTKVEVREDKEVTLTPFEVDFILEAFSVLKIPANYAAKVAEFNTKIAKLK